MKNRILLIGPTPPPYGGQAVIIKKILDSHYSDIELVHVRMVFSSEMCEMNQFKIHKILKLFYVVYKIFRYRIKYKIQVLYYSPSGSSRLPIYRDIFILLCTRWLFKKTIFQFFAGGTTEFLNRATRIEQFFFYRAFRNSDLILVPSIYSSQESLILKPLKEMIIPWSNTYVANKFTQKKGKNLVLNILFVGLLIESKGILVLLEAIKDISKKYKIRLDVLGSYKSKLISNQINSYIKNNNLSNVVFLNGVKLDKEYYDYFCHADVFCFPSFFEAENLPVVLIDALQFGLPIISTNWRSIPEVVHDGRNGFLVEIKNSSQIIEKLEILIQDMDLRMHMGENSKKMYFEKFSDEKFIENMNQAFKFVFV